MTNTVRDDWHDESGEDGPIDQRGSVARAPGHLRAVPEVPTAAAPVRAADPELAFAPGFLRAVVIGGFIGFLVVATLAGAAIGLLTPYGAAAAVGVGAFVGAFGGVGFGAMVAASVHG